MIVDREECGRGSTFTNLSPIFNCKKTITLIVNTVIIFTTTEKIAILMFHDHFEKLM